MKNKMLDNFAIKFIQEHFDEINFNRLGWRCNNIKDAIRDIKKDSSMSSWVIGEVMNWGCDINYFEKIEAEYSDEEYRVIKVDGRYFKFDNDKWRYVEIFPKIIMVEKLIFE